MQSGQLSVFDIFKIGVGPSSSHTLGPWRAAQAFINEITPVLFDKIVGVKVLLYGSLAKTGIGHGTDVAALLGLSGYDPVTIDVDIIAPVIAKIKKQQKLFLNGKKWVDFNYQDDILFLFSESLPQHPNGITFQAFFDNGEAMSSTFF